MSADNQDKNKNPHNIIPYETLKASLDEATAEMEAASAAFLEALNREDPPLLIKIALHNYNAAYAKATSRSNSVMSEYGHLAGVTQKIENQRDEINRKYESMRKTVNQLKKLNLDDDDSPKPNAQNNPPNKGKKRKK